MVLILKIKLEKLPQSQVKLTIDVGFSQIKAIFDRVFKEESQKLELPGFRKGMAPKRLAIEAIGETRLFNQTVGEALNQSFKEALKEKKLIPVSSPKVQITQSPSLFDEKFTRSLIYEAEFDVLPQIKLGDYKKIKISSLKKRDLEVSSEEVEKTLEYLRIQGGKLTEINRPAKTGDRVEIDFQAFERGVPLEKLTSQNHPLILGKKTLLKEIEEKIIGMKKGDQKRFSLVLPNEPRFQELKGKKVDFKIKVNLVQEVTLPALDEQFASRFGQGSLSKLKEAIKKQTLAQKKQGVRVKQEQELANELISKMKAELPANLILRERDKLKQNLLNFLQQRQTSLENYLKSIKSSEQKLEEGLALQAKRNLLLGLALGEIAKIEKIPVDSQEGTKRVVDWLIERAGKRGKGEG